MLASQNKLKALNWASKHRENTYTIERDLDRHAKSFVIIREYVMLLGWKNGLRGWHEEDGR